MKPTDPAHRIRCLAGTLIAAVNDEDRAQAEQFINERDKRQQDAKRACKERRERRAQKEAQRQKDVKKG